MTMESFDTFWAIYSNLVLTLGTNALLALSIYLTLACGMLAMNLEAPFPIALAGGMAAPALVALLMGGPPLRLSGVYLAMATLAFGEVVRIFVLNTEAWTGGALGLNGIPQETMWWHVALALALACAVLALLRRSKVGRAFEAITLDETAAGLMGIDVNAHKMLAFVLGAMLAGLAGALNAHLTFFIGPNEYGFDLGLEILTMAILGGIGGLAGPVLG